MTLRDTVVTAVLITLVLIECKADEIPFRDDEPGTVITETREGNFDQQLVIDHTKYDGPNDAPKTVTLKSHQQSQRPVDFDVRTPYPIGFRSSQYADNKKPNSNGRKGHQSSEIYGPNYDLEGKFSMPSDFQDEISELNIPYTNPYATLPKELKDVGPPPELVDHEDKNDEEKESEGEEDVDDNEEEEEEEEEEETEKDYESPNYDHYFSNDFLEPYDFKDPLQPTRPHKALTDQKTLKTTDFHVVIRDGKKPRITASPSFYSHDPFRKYRTYSVYPRRKLVQRVNQNASAYKPLKQRKRKPRPPQKAQNVRKPLIDSQRPVKSQSAGTCGPRKIIKEIHFHHYDPQLSSQLGGIVPITDSGNEDEEREVIIKTVQMPKTKNNMYDSDYLEHDIKLENAIKRHKLELENHLKERKLSDFNKPMVHHRYGTPRGNDFYLDSHKRLSNVVAKHAPVVEKITVTPDGNGARYTKHQSVKYFYKTPTDMFK